jgi:hypothetical protein
VIENTSDRPEPGVRDRSWKVPFKEGFGLDRGLRVCYKGDHDTANPSTMSKVKLSAKWQLDAALLSRPVDLTALVTMSKSTPDKFTEDDTLHRLVKLLLNEKNKVKSDKDTKLDVLTILANVAGAGSAGNALARVALSNVSEWFDEYISTEESDPSQEPEVSFLLSHERNTRHPPTHTLPFPPALM